MFSVIFLGLCKIEKYVLGKFGSKFLMINWVNNFLENFILKYNKKWVKV